VKKLQEQISSHESEINGLNDDAISVGEQMYRSGQNGYPSLYDLKQKAIEKGWFKKP
jgi:hypothetical protein